MRRFSQLGTLGRPDDTEAGMAHRCRGYLAWSVWTDWIRDEVQVGATGGNDETVLRGEEQRRSKGAARADCGNHTDLLCISGK